MIFDPTCDLISDVQEQFCRILGRSKPGAMKYRYLIENRFSSLAVSGCGEAPPPPHTHTLSAGRIREYPVGVHRKKTYCKATLHGKKLTAKQHFNRI